jgi:hypothetical protein
MREIAYSNPVPKNGPGFKKISVQLNLIPFHNKIPVLLRINDSIGKEQ